MQEGIKQPHFSHYYESWSGHEIVQQNKQRASRMELKRNMAIRTHENNLKEMERKSLERKNKTRNSYKHIK
jgi:hypothetical protein